jgi:hypothetical protein
VERFTSLAVIDLSTGHFRIIEKDEGSALSIIAARLRGGKGV